MKIGFTGTRSGMSERQKTELSIILWKNQGEFHHGDCVGADAEAHQIALSCKWYVVIHPPVESALRAFCTGYGEIRDPRTYLVRNKHIVDSTDGLVVAPFTDQEELRSGTWSTKRYAQKVGKPFQILKR